MNTIPTELSMHDLSHKFFDLMQNENVVEEAANFIYDNIFDDVTMGFIFEFHHGMKTGLTELLEGEKEDEEPFKIVNSSECDIFGFSVMKKTPDSNCSCPNCDRPVSATRFAPHLEKCMGMGRNSSRIASRRIASNSREPTSCAGLLGDDEDDADWAGGSLHSERRKRKIKNNNNRKPNKMHNGNNRNNGSQPADTHDGGATYETMSANEKKNLLLQICGVVSEHTKKLCTRSTRCPQHTEEQRRALRNSVLEPSTPESQSMSLADEAGSPPDSSPSSSCSSSSRKRDRHRAGPKKTKRDRISPSGRD